MRRIGAVQKRFEKSAGATKCVDVSSRQTAIREVWDIYAPRGTVDARAEL
jgi:hypothetical protein